MSALTLQIIIYLNCFSLQRQRVFPCKIVIFVLQFRYGCISTTLAWNDRTNLCEAVPTFLVASWFYIRRQQVANTIFLIKWSHVCGMESTLARDNFIFGADARCRPTFIYRNGVATLGLLRKISSIFSIRLGVNLGSTFMACMFSSIWNETSETNISLRHRYSYTMRKCIWVKEEHMKTLKTSAMARINIIQLRQHDHNNKKMLQKPQQEMKEKKIWAFWIKEDTYYLLAVNQIRHIFLKQVSNR